MTVQTAADEAQPLLAHASTGTIPRRSKSEKLMILLTCGIFILAVDVGGDLSLAPQTAIFEQIICRNLGLLSSGPEAPFTDNPPVSGSDPCKSEAVQAELALVLGYKDMFEVLPSIIMSLPYGVLSDHWGRKPVMYLGIVGLLLGEVWIRLVGKSGRLNSPLVSKHKRDAHHGYLTCPIALWSNVLPLRLVWLSGLFRIIGGGAQVITSVVLVMIADVFSEEERYFCLEYPSTCDCADRIGRRRSSVFNLVLFWPKFWVHPSVPG